LQCVGELDALILYAGDHGPLSLLSGLR
jgi:hypothetical protein